MAYGTNAPFGLQSRFSLTSSTLSGQQNTYAIASGYATSLFAGDPVAFLYDGTIGICPAGTPAVGVFNQVTFYDTLGNFYNQAYWPAGQATLAGVSAVATLIDDPTVEFDIQVSTSPNVSISNATVTAAQIGQNANFAIGGGPAGANLTYNGVTYAANPTTGNTRSGISGYYLDASTINTDSTLSLKIIRFTPNINNGAGIVCNNVVVTLNNHVLKNPGTGSNNDSAKITTVSTTYTALLSDEIIEANPSAGAFTITLPAATATGVRGKRYTIKNNQNLTTAITISGGGTNIDNAATLVITTAYGHVNVISDGTQWYIV